MCFFDGERVARKDFPSDAVSYYFSDHLKTASVISNSSGTITEDEDYYPWGGEIPFVNSDSNHYKFTSKLRDAESGLDYFGARYYGNWYGRFLTPDIPFADQHRDDPQSWNLYTYVQNNPLRLVDDTGRGSRPADDARIQQVLDRGENTTIKAAIQASPNYSAWALERELFGNTSLSPSLVGVAGEAVMSDRMEAQSMFGFVTFQPRPPGMGQPDLLLNYTAAGKADLLDIVGPDGKLGHVPMEYGPAQVYFEVKTTSDFDYMEKGATQTAATAAAIPEAQNAVAVLILDAGAWNNLSQSQQQQLIKDVGRGFIQLQKNLISDAVKRAQKLKTDACRAAGKKDCK